MTYDNMTTTTFRCDKETHWKLKEIFTLKKLKVITGFTQMIHRTIEDHEDSTKIFHHSEYYDELPDNIEWKKLKRIMDLDEL